MALGRSAGRVMGGVSVHNLDVTVYVCISGVAERWEGVCFAARCFTVIRVRTIIPPSMVLIVFFFLLS